MLLYAIPAYFALLLLISLWTGRNADARTFFTANRNAPWYLVAFGMIGASLSGVTFISVPGKVGVEGANQDFAYFQIVLGYIVGYLVIAYVLLPLYYRLRLTSIYGYLEGRFGRSSYKTGASYFLLSRVIGAAFRLYLVAIVIDGFVVPQLGVDLPFWVTVAITIALIWVYTFRGGIKTVIWTDVFQTAAMLLAAGGAVYFLGKQLPTDVFTAVRTSEFSQVFFFEGGWSDPNNFFKQFLAGAFITIVMTGLDQDMMQKNLTISSLRKAQWNMLSFTGVLVLVNLLFLSLGALLYLYAAQIGLETPAKSDYLFPTIAFEHLPTGLGVLFVLGLIAAAYSSADSALTALTTSFCIDILDFEKPDNALATTGIRRMVHLGFSVLLFVVIIVFEAVSDDAVINSLFRIAGYTYGPLLGLYAFGMFTRWHIRDRWVPLVCVFAPLASFVLSENSEAWLKGYTFGFELLIVNGLLTFIGLALLRKAAPDAKAIYESV